MFIKIIWLYHFQKLIVCGAALKTVCVIRRRAEQSQQKTLIFLGLVVLLSLVLLLFSSCSGSGGAGENNKAVSAGGCTDDKLKELKNVFYTCSQNMEITENKQSCVKEAQSIKVKLDGVTCNLNGKEIDGQKIQALFIDPNKEQPAPDPEEDPFFQ